MLSWSLIGERVKVKPENLSENSKPISTTEKTLVTNLTLIHYCISLFREWCWIFKTNRRAERGKHKL